jgi:hypothetical protein
MFEILFERYPALIIPVLGILGLTLVTFVWIMNIYWSRNRKMELESTLKHDMLNRGFQPVDIERVLLASSSGPQPTPAQTISDNEYYLVQKMIEEGHSIEDIERLVRAFKEGSTGIRLPHRVEV